MKVGILNPSPLHREAVGGVTRVHGLARFLASRGHEVHVFAQTSGDARVDAMATEEYAAAGITQRLFPHRHPRPVDKIVWMAGPLPYYAYGRRSPEIQAALRDEDRRAPFDIVHVELAYLAPWLEGVGARAGRVLAEQECMSLQLTRLRRVPLAQRSPYEHVMVHQVGKVKRFERRVLRSFDRVFAITPVEQSYMRTLVPEVDVLPHVVPVDDFAPVAAEPEAGPVLFVGNFNHSPNVHAVRWFVERVWGAIRLARGDARLQIVGPGLDTAMRERLTVAGVEVLGPIADLAERYRAAAVFVNPIVSGGGMRGKVLEAFSCARPVVSTSLGMEGIEGVSGVHYLEADDPRTFAAAVLAYYGDCGLRRAHGSAARQLVASRYDRTVVFSTLEACYDTLARAKRTQASQAVA